MMVEGGQSEQGEVGVRDMRTEINGGNTEVGIIKNLFHSFKRDKLMIVLMLS